VTNMRLQAIETWVRELERRADGYLEAIYYYAGCGRSGFDGGARARAVLQGAASEPPGEEGK